MIKLINKTNVEAADGEFPYGKTKDNSGSNNGTPVNDELVHDAMQFFERLMAESPVVANGIQDNEYDGFQLYEAFRQLSRPYKVYTAILNQSGTVAPAATVLQNEMSAAIVWSRSTTGKYIGKLVGEFTASKTAVFAPNDAFANQFSHVSVVHANNDDVWIQTRDSADVFTDALLSKCTIEIRVYD